MLHKIQSQFVDGILGKSNDIAGQIAATGPFTPEQRLQVYKNNTSLILSDILLKTYPAVTLLVDEKFMRYAADSFWRQRLPSSGDMNDYGADFPAFLKSFQPLEGHPYVADVAALEWAMHESSQSPVFLAAKEHETKLSLQPHVRLLPFEWPAVNLWAFAEKGGEGQPPHLLKGEYFSIVYRKDDSAFVRDISKAGYLFLAALKQDKEIQTDFQEDSFLKQCRNEEIFCVEGTLA